MLKPPPPASPWPAERAGLVNVFPQSDLVRLVVEAGSALLPSKASAPAAYLSPSSAARTVPLPGIAAIAAARGNAGFVSLVCCSLLIRADRSFDELAEGLEELATSAAAAMTQGAQDSGMPLPPSWGELVVAGFSERLGRMRTLRVFGDYGRMEYCDLERPALLPALHGMSCEIERPDLTDILRITRDQLARFRDLGRPVQAGNLVFCEITPEGLSFGWSINVDGSQGARKPRPAAGESA